MILGSESIVYPNMATALSVWMLLYAQISLLNKFKQCLDLFFSALGSVFFHIPGNILNIKALLMIVSILTIPKFLTEYLLLAATFCLFLPSC